METLKIDVLFLGKLENIRKVSIGTCDLLRNMLPDREELIQDIELCLIEGLSNVVIHAYKGNSNKKIRFQVFVNGIQLAIKIFDSGPGFEFNINKITLPERHKSCGRGLFIISQLMDRVEYKMNRQVNYLRMVKYLKE